MCILFLYINNDPDDGKYSIVLANNRDEYFLRPTKPACVWSDNFISGLDQQPGREGGTWLGVSKNNKISNLLNILQTKVDLDKEGRGNLVVDFLKGRQSAKEYLNSLKVKGSDYNGFSLLCLERKEKKWNGSLYCNKDFLGVRNMVEGYQSLSNSVPTHPWQKTVITLPQFKEIVEKNSSDESCDDVLTDQLIDMLSDRTPLLPDAVLEKQGAHMSDSLLRERSAVCVYSPSRCYGTRTNTVLLVDKEGHAVYTERTMREPIDIYNPVWDKVQHHFDFCGAGAL